MADEAPPEGTTPVAALRATVQWLVACSGAVAAAAITRLPTSDQHLSGTGNLLTAAAVIMVVATALTTLWKAAAVLAVGHRTASSLAPADLAARNSDETITDPVLNAIATNRTECLGSYDSIDDMLRARLRAHDTLRDPEATPQALQRARAVMDITLDMAQRIAMIADYQAALRRYASLRTWMTRAGPLLLCGLVMYLVAPFTGHAPPADVAATAPIRARITVTDPRAATLETPCPASRTGVIIGGTLPRPIVVVDAAGSHCPTRRLRSGDGLIVRPVP